MTGFGSPKSHGRLWRWVTSAILLAAGWSAGFANAQDAKSLPAAVPVDPFQVSAAPAALPIKSAPAVSAADNMTKTDPDVKQAGCASCLGGLLGGGSEASDDSACACGSDCGGCACKPGVFHQCSCCDADGPAGRFLCGLYNCICCPDPCYTPRWIAAANASFFVDSVRPQTQTAVRWESGIGYQFPDRSEFFWKEVSMGVGASGAVSVNRLNYNQLSLYTEAAIGMAGVFTSVPYIEVKPDGAPDHAGFGDLIVGTKSVLLDCELLQVGFQFKTIIPVGNSTEGLGTGHLSLEPSLLSTLKLGPETYLQGQLALWIPIAGDPGFAGTVLHYHFSLNHTLYRFLPDVVLIGTLEFNGYSFESGEYTNPNLPAALNPVSSGGGTYLSIGPGFRLVICDKCDIGLGTAFMLGDNHGGPEEVYRTEFRWRF